jgi:hypothetical protein
MKKALGMQKCKTQIRTQEHYEKLKSAILNYAQHIKEPSRKQYHESKRVSKLNVPQRLSTKLFVMTKSTTLNCIG